MIKTFAAAAAAALLLTALPATAGAKGAGGPTFTPGADGIGDPYFPQAGNGGYDVAHYDLAVSYDPPTDMLRGRAVIVARATQNLSSFNLDLDGLTVRRVKVNGVVAGFSRLGGELTITPHRGLPKGRTFTVVVTYDGVPEAVVDILGTSGFFHTDDGTLVAGQPRVASTWYPVNDHPLDTASYKFAITVPAGLEAIANGVLTGTSTKHGRTTWNWIAKEPMASYLTTMTVGEFDVSAYRANGVKYWDAVDPDLYAPVAVPNGTQFAWSDRYDGAASYKRMTRVIDVPAGGGSLSFTVTRDTESAWDFFFVEARTPGGDNWTTLPDANGHTSNDLGASCSYWPATFPFVEHYQTLPADPENEPCTPSGTTGSWNAATGASDGAETWSLDLGAYQGGQVEISFASMNDSSIQGAGVFVDDIVGPNGSGSTGFEPDADTSDGWVAQPNDPGGIANPNTWRLAAAVDVPPGIGANVDASFGRQPEIVAFLSGFFGAYPFRAAGGIVDDLEGLGFALENQTRPIYAKEFFGDTIGGDAVIVHEYAHQWFGDNLPLAGWQHIWLNEGFATYAEWLWSEYEGFGTADEIFGFYTSVIPPDSPFWALPIGDPGPDLLFDEAVYLRGGMTLHALRLEVGDTDFFKILKLWPKVMAGKNVSTPQFIDFAERVSGEQLDDLFEAWLFTPEMPAMPVPLAATARTAAVSTATAPAVARAQMLRWGLATK